VEGEKMSKSKGNYHTVRELIAAEDEGGRGVNPLALRLALISGQYRNPLNFTFDHLKVSAKHIRRFEEATVSVEDALKHETNGSDRIGDRLEDLYENAIEAMLDDLNTPPAIAAALEGVKLIEGMGTNLNAASARSADTWLRKINDLLGIVRADGVGGRRERDEETDTSFAVEVERLLAEREEARAARNYERADAIRAILDEMNVEVMDSADGTRWRRKVTV
jgi:cysteinyl-tRNA synthetase